MELRWLWKGKVASPNDDNLDGMYRKLHFIAREKSTAHLIEALTEAKDMARFVKIFLGHNSKP